MDHPKIADLLTTYSYKKTDLIESKATFYQKGLESVITPFYNHDRLPRSGECTELMQTAFHDFTATYPDKHIIRACGNEPNYFPADIFRLKRGSHWFLLLFDSDPMQGLPAITFDTTTPRLRDVLAINPYVIDPSLGICTPYLRTDYRITHIFAQDAKIPSARHSVMTTTSGPVLGKTDSGEVVALHTHRNYQSGMALLFVEKKKKPYSFDLHDTRVDLLLQSNDDMLAIVDALRRAPVHEVDDLGPYKRETYVLR